MHTLKGVPGEWRLSESVEPDLVGWLFQEAIMDRSKFYEVMRSEFGSLSQSQVDGTNKLLDEGERRTLPMNQLAYVLSTS